MKRITWALSLSALLALNVILWTVALQFAGSDLVPVWMTPQQVEDFTDQPCDDCAEVANAR